MVWVGCLALLAIGLYLAAGGALMAWACFGLSGRIGSGEAVVAAAMFVVGVALIWLSVWQMPFKIVAI